MADLNGNGSPRVERIEHRKALDEIKSAVDPKVFLLLSKLLGNIEIRSKGPVKGHYTATSDSYGLVVIKVEDRDLVRVHKISNVFFNQVLVRPDGLYLDYHPRLKDLLEGERYKKAKVSEVFSQTPQDPQLVRVRKAFLSLNLKPSGGTINFVQYPKSPVSFVLKGVLKNKAIPANTIYYTNLPGGLDVFLTHESDIGNLAIASILIPETSDRAKIRLLESHLERTPNLSLLGYLLWLRENV